MVLAMHSSTASLRNGALGCMERAADSQTTMHLEFVPVFSVVNDPGAMTSSTGPCLGRIITVSVANGPGALTSSPCLGTIISVIIGVDIHGRVSREHERKRKKKYPPQRSSDEQIMI